MGGSDKEAAAKELPPSIYVCPADTSENKPVCAAVAIGRTLELTVYDYRTHKPVVGATVQRQTIGGADKVKMEYSLPTMEGIKNYRTAEEADQCRAAINEYDSLKEEEKKAKAEKKALSGQKQNLLKVHKAKLGWYEKIIAERERWVGFMQTGLKMLKAYEGEINARMDPDLGKMIGEYWHHWTGGNSRFNVKEHWKKAAGLLLQQLKKKYVTDDGGKVYIPLPDNYVGKVEIEFVNFKMLDPANAVKALGAPWDPRETRIDPDQRVDYDLGTASGEMHANDEAGSRKLESRWKLSIGSDRYSFQNFIEVDIGAPNETERTKPISKWTLALLWCQPVCTEVDKNYIYDPVDPRHPDDSLLHMDRVKTHRGLPGRGLADGGRPTLLASTIGASNRSKHYGVWGDKGRLEKVGSPPQFVPKFHRGIDCAGRVGDPIFAVVGGKVIKIFKNQISGNVILFSPWNSGDGVDVPGLVQILHLKDGGIKVKEGQSVKAGDYLADMGRTGNFSPPPPHPPSPYPTHTHFIFDQKLELVHPPPGLKEHAGVIPHNGLPRMLPCGGDYPDYAEDAVGNPKHCNFDYVWFVAQEDYCFAVEELACPFMPETITLEDLKESGSRKARRRFQAQLKWLHKGNKDIYSDPGNIDGDLGIPPHAKMTGADKHRPVRRWLFRWHADPPPLLFEAEKNEIFPLVNDEKIGDLYKVKLTAEHVIKYAEKAKANGQELRAGDFVLVHHAETKIEWLRQTPPPKYCKQPEIRKAIKTFNDRHDPEAGYEISQKCLITLNNLTGLIKGKDGNSNGCRWQRPGDPLI